jgi:hypothetical protein
MDGLPEFAVTRYRTKLRIAANWCQEPTGTNCCQWHQPAINLVKVG